MDGTILPLMEDFYTIQGQGFYRGTAAYFIRLAGWHETALADLLCTEVDVAGGELSK